MSQPASAVAEPPPGGERQIDGGLEPGSEESRSPGGGEAGDPEPAAQVPADPGSPSLAPAQVPASGGCGGPAGPPTYVYAFGILRPIFPDLSVEQEFRYAVDLVPGTSETSYHKVFTWEHGQFFYIAENCCWLLEIGGVDTYLLQPRSLRELHDLVDAVPPDNEIEPRMTVVIGLIGPVAPPELCGFELPVVLVNQIYHFKLDELVGEIEGGDPPMTKISREAIVGVLRTLELKPNPGDTDIERALNYVALRYREVYEKVGELCTGDGAGWFLSDVRTEPGEVQGTRRIIDVVFELQRRNSEEVIFYYCGVDVTGLFPFLKSALRLYVPVTQDQGEAAMSEVSP